jgi:hypothetical protein
MDKKEIAVLFLSSAVIGALFSSVVTALAQWRERVARKKELLLKVSVDLSKTYMERVAKASGGALVTVPEVTVLATMHEVVTEIFKHGSVSAKNQKKLRDVVNLDLKA